MKKCFCIAVLSALCLSSVSLAETVSLPSAGSGPNAPKSVQDSLKAAVAGMATKFGDMEPWQRKLFDEEVVTQYSRFVRDYRPSTGGLSVDVDLDSIKSFLAFYAPKALKQEKALLFISLKTEASCTKCVDSSENVKRLLKNRAERRGMVPVFSKYLDRDMRGAFKQKKAVGVEEAEIRQAPEDPEHPDDQRYSIQLSLSFPQDKTVGSSKNDFSHSSKLEILDSDSIETAIARLSNDAWVAAGEQNDAISRSQSVADAGNQGLLVEVAGIKDFKHFSHVKEKLQAAFGENSPITEKKVSRGVTVFSVGTNKSVEDAKRILTGLAMEPGALFLNDVTDKTIKTEIR